MTFTGFTKGLHVFAVCNMLTFSGLQISAYELMCSPIPLVKPISVIHSFNTYLVSHSQIAFFSFILGRERKRSGCTRLTPIAQIMQGDDF